MVCIIIIFNKTVKNSTLTIFNFVIWSSRATHSEPNTDCSSLWHLYPTHRWFHMPLLGHETGICPLSTFPSESEHQKITGSKRNSFQTHHQHISHAFCLAEKKKKKETSQQHSSSLNHSNFILSFSSNQRVCQRVILILISRRWK